MAGPFTRDVPPLARPGPPITQPWAQRLYVAVGGFADRPLGADGKEARTHAHAPRLFPNAKFARAHAPCLIATRKIYMCTQAIHLSTRKICTHT